MVADDDSESDVMVASVEAANSLPTPDSSLGAAALPAALLQPSNGLLEVVRGDPSLRLDLPPLEAKVDEPNYFAGIKTWEDEKEVS